MNNVIHIEPKSNMSAQITLTNEYLVLKGKNYILRDWYIKRNSKDLVIPKKDILAIDFVKMRSKGC